MKDLGIKGVFAIVTFGLLALPRPAEARQLQQGDADAVTPPVTTTPEGLDLDPWDVWVGRGRAAERPAATEAPLDADDPWVGVELSPPRPPVVHDGAHMEPTDGWRVRLATARRVPTLVLDTSDPWAPDPGR